MKNILIIIAAVLLVGCGESNENKALKVAVIIGDVEGVRRNLEAGANVNLTIIGGDTLLHSAALVGHKEICQILIAEGVEANALNDSARTPLDMANMGHQTETANLLREWGCKTWKELHKASKAKQSTKK
jgi:ankyrin repeat protein